jgi:hypothetical protein
MTVRTIQRKRKTPGFPKPDLYFGDIPHWKMERIVEFERNLMRKALDEPATPLSSKTDRAPRQTRELTDAE